MAKAKLQQIKLNSGAVATHPPFPGGWVLAIFDALNAFAPTLAVRHQLPISQRTRERIKAAESVKKPSYDQIEIKLVELITVLFPNVSVVNGFAKKYVDEYFRLWKQAAEQPPQMAKSLGFEPGESSILGRALVRDLVLRLCYLESCERQLSNGKFNEAELAFFQHDSPMQVYQTLFAERARILEISQEKLAEQLRAHDRNLRWIKSGIRLPSIKLLVDLKRPGTSHRMLAGIGFMDQLLKKLGLHKSVMRNEFLAIASVFFRNHPKALQNFTGKIPRTTKSGAIEFEACDFEGLAEFGDGLLLHPGFNELYMEMPDALWRAHLYSLKFARIIDLARTYLQFSKGEDDQALEKLLAEAEQRSCGANH